MGRFCGLTAAIIFGTLRSMKILIILTLTLLSFCLVAKDNSGIILEYRTGDVILVPLYCASCRVIEDENQSRFSHSGVVIRNETGEIFVAEALGKVKLTKLSEFLSRVRPGQMAFLYRPIEFDVLLNYRPGEFKSIEAKMRRVFVRDYEGLGFDEKFSWTNRDSKGRELLYCSEFVAKFLNRFLRHDFMPRPMSFDRNYDFWTRYFGGQPPQGELGNSPGDFERSPFLNEVRSIPRG
jgi:hypothetical protein